MTFSDFTNQAFVGFLVGTFGLAGWFCRAVVIELREMKQSISQMNVTLAVVVSTQGYQTKELDELKARVDRIETKRE